MHNTLSYSKFRCKSIQSHLQDYSVNHPYSETEIYLLFSQIVKKYNNSGLAVYVLCVNYFCSTAENRRYLSTYSRILANQLLSDKYNILLDM